MPGSVGLDPAHPVAPAAATASPVTLDLFFAAVLQGIGAPVTANNINNMKAWAAAENGANFTPTGYTGPAWNPLNIEHSYNGSTPWGPAVAKGQPVQQYGSAQDGVTATANEIDQWIPAFQPISAALKGNVSCSSFSSVVTASGWGTGPFDACGGSSVSATLGTGTVSDPTGFLGQAASAVGGVASSAVSAVTSPLSAIGTLATDLSSAAFWKRIGVFALGGALLVIGGVVFFESTPTGRKVTGDAASAALLA